MWKLCFWLIAGLLLAVGTANGEEKEKPKAEKTAVAELPDQLKRDGILISGKTYKQIFQAYIGNSRPFITSDSLLNAYHVLYEESIFRLEKKQAGVLKKLVNDLYQQLCQDRVYDAFRFSGEMTLNALSRDKLVVGVAVKLFDPQFKLEDTELNKLADDEVKRIIKAEGIFMPKWLGKPSEDFAGIDYSRFKPCGFYCKTDRLQRYFRATVWLQTIPFKVKDDTELLAFMILRYCWYKQTSRLPIVRDSAMFFRIYDLLLGKQDGQGINGGSMYSSSYSRNDLKTLRERLLNSIESQQINDTLRVSPLSETGITDLRIMPARKTPDAILFSLTTDPRKTGQNFPSGLEVSALLGAKFAMAQLPPKVRKIIKRKRNIINKKSFYGLYLEALKALFENKDSRLPAFMKNKSWEIKSCNTALAGWAQMRHTWSLQAKQNINYLGLAPAYPGFVEPNEAFWGRMALLCERTKIVLSKTGCMEYNPADDIELYRTLSSQLEKNDINMVMGKHPEIMLIIEPAFIAAEIINEGKEPSSEVEGRKQRAAALKKLVSILETGSLNKYPKLKYIFKEYAFDLDALWTQLHNTCLKLQVISLKQLNGTPCSPEENEFIADYGKIIAGIMLYGGNSYLTPRDDAVRAVDIFTDVRTSSRPRYLEVGIGRPREILVLYPTPEGKVLCKGAILPYYEFFNKNRLTDSEWKKILDSKAERPAIPKWLAPIVQTGKLEVPVWEKRY
jgi:hypothetical protein